MYSVPFSFTTDHAQVDGILRIDADDLVFEFQSKDAYIGLFKTGVKEIRVSMGDLSDVVFRRGWFFTRLRIQARTLRAVADFPGNSEGTVVLGIRRRHRQAAAMLAAELSRMQAEALLAQINQRATSKSLHDNTLEVSAARSDAAKVQQKQMGD